MKSNGFLGGFLALGVLAGQARSFAEEPNANPYELFRSFYQASTAPASPQNSSKPSEVQRRTCVYQLSHWNDRNFLVFAEAYRVDVPAVNPRMVPFCRTSVLCREPEGRTRIVFGSLGDFSEETIVNELLEGHPLQVLSLATTPTDLVVQNSGAPRLPLNRMMFRQAKDLLTFHFFRASQKDPPRELEGYGYCYWE